MPRLPPSPQTVTGWLLLDEERPPHGKMTEEGRDEVVLLLIGVAVATTTPRTATDTVREF